MTDKPEAAAVAPGIAPHEPLSQNEQAWEDLRADGGLPESQTPMIDIGVELHRILGAHGIASLSARDQLAGLPSALIKWAADACRQSQSKEAGEAEHEIRTLREQQVCPKHSLAGIGWCQPCLKEREQAEAQLAATRAALIALRDELQDECRVAEASYDYTRLINELDMRTFVSVSTLRKWIDALTQAAGLDKESQ